MAIQKQTKKLNRSTPCIDQKSRIRHENSTRFRTLSWRQPSLGGKKREQRVHSKNVVPRTHVHTKTLPEILYVPQDDVICTQDTNQRTKKRIEKNVCEPVSNDPTPSRMCTSTARSFHQGSRAVKDSSQKKNWMTLSGLCFFHLRSQGFTRIGKGQGGGEREICNVKDRKEYKYWNSSSPKCKIPRII